MQSDKNKSISIEEAADQVKVIAIRLALMHLSYARTLVDELGKDKAKKIIIKSIMEYGRMVGERIKDGEQDLPHYGLHDSYSYKDAEFLDTRDITPGQTENMDWDVFKVHGCVLSQIFKEYDEEELGRLYCYVDSAKSMAADPSQKLIHTACEVCGDDHCAFSSLPASEEEVQMFYNKDLNWKDVDPVLDKHNHSKPNQY
jgi:hypothetical protein